MIYIDYDNVTHVEPKITLNLSGEVFNEALKIYREFPEYRYDPIVVMKGDDRFCLLRWKSNNVTVSKRLNAYRLASCDEYLDYSFDDNMLDFRLIEKPKAIYFTDIDEYSIFIANLALKRFSDKKIIFKDERARYFICDAKNSNIYYGIKEDDVMSQLSDVTPELLMTIGGERISISKDMVFNMNYTSLSVMHSIYWLSKETHFGDKNPDKRIALIKSPLAFEGIAGLIRYVLNKAEAYAKCGYDIVPVADLGIIGDENQFFAGSGENVWEMFFEPLSDISVSEAYGSAHVLGAMEAMKTTNPWLWIEDATSDYTQLVGKYLRFNETTHKFLDKQYDEVVPSIHGKILGVVGRGSDYNVNTKGYKGDLMRPLTPREILDKTIKFVRENDYDFVFLATEDADVFDLYMNSEIADKVLYVDQRRVSYKEHDDTQLLADIYKEDEKRDGYTETLKYLGIINILSKCDALLSTTLCGAARIAVGLNDGEYEYIDVPGLIGQDLELIGSGGMGSVYRLSGGRIYKEYSDKMPFVDIIREERCAKAAFKAQISTPRSYGIYTRNNLYGIVFEEIKGRMLSDILMDNQEAGMDIEGSRNDGEDSDKIIRYASDMGRLLKSLHSAKLDEHTIPLTKDIYREYLDRLDNYYTPEEVSVMSRFLENVPDRLTTLHNDFHTKNIMLKGDELVIIDMAELSLGHPVFDLANVYDLFVLLADRTPSATMRFTGISADISPKVWHYMIRAYMGSVNDENISSLESILSSFSLFRVALSPAIYVNLSEETLKRRVDRSKRDFIGRIDEHIKALKLIDDILK